MPPPSTAPAPANPYTESPTPYDVEFVAPDSYDEYDFHDEILNHLMFYKSIISEEDDPDKINRYVEMVRTMKRGDHISIRNEFDRSISITLELVVGNQLDPWDINLVKFSSLYLKRVKEEGEVDFVAAGRIIFMAWTILKVKSDDLLSRSQPPQPAQAENPLDSVGVDGEWMERQEDFDYTSAVLSRDEPPIEEMVWRKGARPVTLLELVGALETATRDSETMEILRTEHEKERARLNVLKERKVQGMIHPDDLEEEIAQTLSRLAALAPGGDRVLFSAITGGSSTDGRLTTFVSLLFLAHEGKVRIGQDEFPRSDIWVERIV